MVIIKALYMQKKYICFDNVFFKTDLNVLRQHLVSRSAVGSKPYKYNGTVIAESKLCLYNKTNA